MSNSSAMAVSGRHTAWLLALVLVLWLSTSTAQSPAPLTCDLGTVIARCVNNNTNKIATTCRCPSICPGRCVNITNCLVCHPTSTPDPQYLCDMCQGGYSLTQNRTQCEACPLGTYASATDGAACVAGSSCHACPEGLTTPRNASTSAAACTCKC